MNHERTEGANPANGDHPEIEFEAPRELDGFIESLALILSRQPDITHPEVGHRTLLGNLRGKPEVSKLIADYARKHGFHGALKQTIVKPVPLDQAALLLKFRDISDERAQSLSISSEMRSSGRGFIGYQRAIVTLYVPPDRSFTRHFGNRDVYPLYAYREIGEPIVLLSSREVKSEETEYSVALVRSGSEQINVWRRRFALARTASSGFEQGPRYKPGFHSTNH